MNSAPTPEDIRNLLSEIRDPETGRDIVSTKQVGPISVSDKVTVEIGLTTHSLPLKQDFSLQVAELLSRKVAGHEFDIRIGTHDRPPVELGQIGLRCKSVIAVGSGKGGVGKSTVSTSLAMALKRAGCRVGLMDADVYGPSIPHLTGLQGHPTHDESKKIQPIDFDGMPVMSIGFMVPPDQAVIWRGPMLHSAVTQFLRDTQWGELDYLIIDMPPGTGDIALTLSQLLPLSGAVVVCTPQEVALLDAIKAVAMFDKVKIPMLGIVENMSTFICPDNNKRYDIFGNGGAKEFAEQSSIPFLGEIPINIQLRERGDAGQTMANFDDPNVGPYLEKIAYQLVRCLADRAAAAPTKPTLPVLN